MKRFIEYIEENQTPVDDVPIDDTGQYYNEEDSKNGKWPYRPHPYLQHLETTTDTKHLESVAAQPKAKHFAYLHAMLKNPHLTKTAYDHLENRMNHGDNYAYVEENTHAEAVKNIAKYGSTEMRQHAASEWHVPEAAHIQMHDPDLHVQCSVARNHSDLPGVFETLKDHPDHEVRDSLAGGTRKPEHLEYLAKDPHPDVRASVAQRGSVPNHVAMHLTNDDDSNVARTAFLHVQTAGVVKDRWTEDGDHDGFSDEEKVKAADNLWDKHGLSDWSTHDSLAKWSPNVHHLEALADSPDPRVRRSVAERGHLPINRKMAETEKDHEVHHGLADTAMGDPQTVKALKNNPHVKGYLHAVAMEMRGKYNYQPKLLHGHVEHDWSSSVKGATSAPSASVKRSVMDKLLGRR